MKAQAPMNRKNPELSPGTKSTRECSITSQLRTCCQCPGNSYFIDIWEMSPELFYEAISVRSNNMENIHYIWCIASENLNPIIDWLFPLLRRLFSLLCEQIHRTKLDSNLTLVWLWKTMKVLILCEPKTPRASFEILKSSLRFIASLWNGCSNT